MVGAGPAGLAYADVASGRGHQVTLFDAAAEIGGQPNLAKRIPGKEEFHETLRYFSRIMELRGVDQRLNTRVTAKELKAGNFDKIVIATGIEPRVPDIEGIGHEKVCGYIDVINGRTSLGRSVAIAGAGGIGFDIAELVSHSGIRASLDVDVFAREWGIDFANHPRGGVTGVEPQVAAADRTVYLMQRKDTPVGRGLGKTTGWTHRLTLGRRGVKMMNGVEYLKIDDDGLHIRVGGEVEVLDVDNVIICAGQTPSRQLYDELGALGLEASLIGGAFDAAALDAKRAINQACRLAAAV